MEKGCRRQFWNIEDQINTEISESSHVDALDDYATRVVVGACSEAATRDGKLNALVVEGSKMTYDRSRVLESIVGRDRGAEGQHSDDREMRNSQSKTGDRKTGE